MAAALPAAVAGPALLDAEHAAFMQGGVSIVAASRALDNAPTLNRASGCRVSRQRRQVTLFFWQRQARPLLDAVAESGLIAVVFSEPPTHRTIQLKGTVTRLTPARQTDAPLIRRYRRAFADALTGLGFAEPFAFGLTHGEPDGMIAMTFTPTAIFMQTPGPGAGEPLVLKP